MAKTLHRLTVKQIEAAVPGKALNDGGGLYYRASKRGGGRWVFRFSLPGQSQREMGLGPFPAIPLALAREKAADARKQVALGVDPIAAAHEAAEQARATVAAEANIMTFGDYADTFVEWKIRSAGFTNPKHIYQWRQTFKEYAAPLRPLRLDAITRKDVLAVLAPIWDTKHETAKRVRGRLEQLFDHAAQNDAFEGENPARWKLLNATLSKPRKLTEGHQPAMPWRQVPDFIARLRDRDAAGALALEFLILSASRSGEVREATWGEIDLDGKTWTIPANRMKTRRDTKRRDHIVPLSARMIELLEAARALAEIDNPAQEGPRPDQFVFPGAKAGRPLSDMTLRAVMRRLGVEDSVPHGFRSAFRDWAGSRHDVPRELAEEALAHVLGDVESAYRREQSVERRRVVMEAWAAHCDGEAPAEGGDIVQFGRAS
ncbi:tyrosine-type recombinase/integrase [Sinisalibacter lacisalsi]|uniref:Integrase n=1 Tax=Sinisalibacter lacisalsi TaxID=1526570 RepID=A0ABQ1QUY4_9RHOB|nr:site-specific integrase [Sinisalibacter lacisalsi]GGD44734.1 integrase [Sinisalibacter lacisalsi]